jgi:hypothetical protein
MDVAVQFNNDVALRQPAFYIFFTGLENQFQTDKQPLLKPYAKATLRHGAG